MLRPHSSRWFWLAAVFLAITLPVAQMAVAAQAGSVVCCCGEHAADDDCGCPDCPSAVGDASDDHDHGAAVLAGTDQVRRCGADSHVGTPPSHFDMTLPVAVWPAQRLGALMPAPPGPGRTQTTLGPESPPPEQLLAF